MAHSLSAAKRVRQNEKRRARNRARRSLLKTLAKRFLAAVQAGDLAKAEEQYRHAAKYFDRIAGKGTIHRNAASRHKSRMMLKLNALKAKAPA